MGAPRVRPFSLAGRGLETPTVSRADLSRGERTPVDGETSTTLRQYTDEIVASGFPAIRDLTGRGHRTQMESGRQEIDLIVVRPDGRIVAIEVKLARAYRRADGVAVVPAALLGP